MLKLVNGLFGLFNRLCTFCLMAMVVLMFTNVVLRYGFHSGIMISEEMSRWFFAWMTFIGAVVAMRDGTHLGTDMLVVRLSMRGKKICMFMSIVIMLACCLVLIHGSWTQFNVAKSVAAPVSGLSMGVFYSTGIFFGVLATIVLCVNLYRLLSGKMTKVELQLGAESPDEALERLQETSADEGKGEIK